MSKDELKAKLAAKIEADKQAKMARAASHKDAIAEMCRTNHDWKTLPIAGIRRRK